MNALRKALVGATALGVLALGFAAPASAVPGGVSLGRHTSTTAFEPQDICVKPGKAYGNKINITNPCDHFVKIEVLYVDGPYHYLGSCILVPPASTRTFVGPDGYHYVSWEHCD